MSYIVIGIHGLANKPPADTLDDWWRQAIIEGLQKNCGKSDDAIEFTSVYWADALHDPLQDPELMDEPYRPAPSSGPLKTYADGWLDDVVAGVIGIGGGLLDITKRYLGVDKTADAILEAKLQDLHRYYEDQQTRDELRTRLENMLTNDPKVKDRRIMLIAHSMGCLIAYDVLRAIGRKHPGFSLDHFVTIGSPLGLPHVKMRIYEENDLVRTPSVVKRWTNFADRRDVVALDVRLGDDYAPNDSGVRVKDDLVINGYRDNKDDPNFHKSYGYLRAPEMSRVIRAFI